LVFFNTLLDNCVQSGGFLDAIAVKSTIGQNAHDLRYVRPADWFGSSAALNCDDLMALYRPREGDRVNPHEESFLFDAARIHNTLG